MRESRRFVLISSLQRWPIRHVFRYLPFPLPGLHIWILKDGLNILVANRRRRRVWIFLHSFLNSGPNLSTSLLERDFGSKGGDLLEKIARDGLRVSNCQYQISSSLSFPAVFDCLIQSFPTPSGGYNRWRLRKYGAFLTDLKDFRRQSLFRTSAQFRLRRTGLCQLVYLVGTRQGVLWKVAQNPNFQFRCDFSGDVPESFDSTSRVSAFVCRLRKWGGMGSDFATTLRQVPSRLTRHHLPARLSFMYQGIIRCGTDRCQKMTRRSMCVIVRTYSLAAHSDQKAAFRSLGDSFKARLARIILEQRLRTWEEH